MPIEQLNDESLGEWSSRTSYSLNGKPMEETKSGLLLVAEPPKPVEPIKPKYPSTQIQDEKDRKLARKAMYELWHALDLGGGLSGVVIPRGHKDLHHKLWKMFGEVILGEMPDGEVKC